MLPVPTPGRITSVVVNDPAGLDAAERLVDPTQISIQRLSPLAALSALSIASVYDEGEVLVADEESAVVLTIEPAEVDRLIELLAPHASARYRDALDFGQGERD